MLWIRASIYELGRGGKGRELYLSQKQPKIKIPGTMDKLYAFKSLKISLRNMATKIESNIRDKN